MEKVKISHPSEKTKKIGNKKMLVLSFRWIILTFVTLYFSFAYESDSKSMNFFWTLVLAVVYNVIITLYFMNQINTNKTSSRLVIFCDIVIVGIISYHLGGINSDMYILFFFLIGYCGIFSSLSYTLIVGVFVATVYSLSCIFSYKSTLEEFNYWRLIGKDILILLAAYGITQVNGEVKKYGEMHKKEFKLARTDKLTGLANRHYFDQKLGEEVEYVDFSGNPLNILMFDLDNFKRFNDTYGHLWGDKLLTLFSDIIMQNIRKSDIPVRYGGEEFLILIRDLDAQMAKGVAERIRRQLEKQRIYVGDDDNRKKVTVSCGLSQYPRNSSNIKEAIDFADKALYHAKEVGKNIVVSFDEIGHVQQGVQIDIDTYMDR